MSSLLRLCLLSSCCVLVACGPLSAPVTEGPDSGACIQVIEYARPSSGGECVGYATPCDVPQGYVECCGGLAFGSCSGQSARCVDDPTDACDPSQGDRDCTGICQP
ncbi:hypothetical protein [Archangium sp.]|uniref:hypothetical protein n=1 Tax=Archangium sp. TaxID=1872627 RepID=UPI003899E3AF